jgi:hypothetical protein
VRRLVARHVSSVEQLEILLLLRSDPTRAWTADAISAELRGDARSVRMRLGELAEAGLVAPSGAEYHYAPASDELARAVDALDDCYARRRHAVVALIFSPAGDRG